MKQNVVNGYSFGESTLIVRPTCVGANLRTCRHCTEGWHPGAGINEFKSEIVRLYMTISSAASLY